VHPFFVGTQAHPELKSRPTRPHPLFAAFVRAAIAYRAADRLPVELRRDRAGGDPAPARRAAHEADGPRRVTAVGSGTAPS
jgi:CTP synthase